MSFILNSGYAVPGLTWKRKRDLTIAKLVHELKALQEKDGATTRFAYLSGNGRKEILNAIPPTKSVNLHCRKILARLDFQIQTGKWPLFREILKVP